MARRVLAVLGLLAIATVSSAQPEAPANISAAPRATTLSYLRTGMHVGISYIEGTANALIVVYNDEDYATVLAIRKVARTPDLTGVAKENPVIQRELGAFIPQHGLAVPSVDRIHRVGPFRTTFGTIGAIGDDYLLIELDDDVKIQPNAALKRCRIIPKAFIASIDLKANPGQPIHHPQQPKSQDGG